MCTLYKGKPFGPALIHCDHDTDAHAFEGIGIFTNGVLHNGPFLCKTRKGKRKLFTHMIDGRPADKYYSTYFFEHGHKRIVDSFSMDDVSGQ